MVFFTFVLSKYIFFRLTNWNWECFNEIPVDFKGKQMPFNINRYTILLFPFDFVQTAAQKAILCIFGEFLKP